MSVSWSSVKSRAIKVSDGLTCFGFQLQLNHHKLTTSFTHKRIIGVHLRFLDIQYIPTVVWTKSVRMGSTTAAALLILVSDQRLKQSFSPLRLCVGPGAQSLRKSCNLGATFGYAILALMQIVSNQLLLIIVLRWTGSLIITKESQLDTDLCTLEASLPWLALIFCFLIRGRTSVKILFKISRAQSLRKSRTMSRTLGGLSCLLGSWQARGRWKCQLQHRI